MNSRMYFVCVINSCWPIFIFRFSFFYDNVIGIRCIYSYINTDNRFQIPTLYNSFIYQSFLIFMSLRTHFICNANKKTFSFFSQKIDATQQYCITANFNIALSKRNSTDLVVTSSRELTARIKHRAVRRRETV